MNRWQILAEKWELRRKNWMKILDLTFTKFEIKYSQYEFNSGLKVAE